MRVPIDPGDRKILIASGVLLVLLTAASLFLSTPASERQGFPSTYSSYADGARAAYLLLAELGYNAEQWVLPLTDLPREARGVVLILAAPFMPPSAEDRHAIRAFLSNGGRVIFTGGAASGFLPDAGIAERDRRDFEWREFKTLAPSPLSVGAPSITMAARIRWEMKRFEHVGVYGDEKAAVVVTYPVGEGSVVWWAGSTPLENAGIQRPGNLALFLNSVGAPRDGDGEAVRVLWDEYYHGRRGGLWSYIRETPVPWMLLQLGMVLVALFVAYARRVGPVRPPQVESRLSPLEFVETLGDLYHHAGAASAAVETALQQFRYRLTRRLALPVNEPAGKLAVAVRERLRFREPGLQETLQRAERAALDPDLDASEALRLVQALHHYTELLDLKPRRG